MNKKYVPLLLIVVFANVLYFVVFSGKRAPELPMHKTTLKDENGNKFSIQDAENTVVMVSFFQSWCGDCRREQPELEALQQAVGGEDK